MLPDVRMIGRALKCQIQRDLQTDLLCAAKKLFEVGQGPQRRMDGLVPAARGADRPGAADVFGPGSGRVVGSFASGGPDRVDGRQVHHVEAHRLNLRQPGFAVLESAVPAAIARGGPGKQLVPGAHPGSRTVGDYLEFARILRGDRPIGVLGRELKKLRIAGQEKGIDRKLAGDSVGRLEQPIDRPSPSEWLPLRAARSGHPVALRACAPARPARLQMRRAKLRSRRHNAPAARPETAPPSDHCRAGASTPHSRLGAAAPGSTGASAPPRRSRHVPP